MPLRLEDIHAALLSAFSEEELKALVYFQLDEDLSEIPRGTTLSAQVVELIKWAKHRNRLEELVRAAYARNSRNPELQGLVAQLDSLAPEERDLSVPSPPPERKRPHLRSSRFAAYVVAILVLIGVLAVALAVTLGIGSSALRAVPTAPAVVIPEPRTSVIPTPFPYKIYIPAGPFCMGSDDEKPDQAPRHPVDVHEFWIAKYEVTNENYKAFLDASNRNVPFMDTEWAQPYDWDLLARQPPSGKMNYPVVLVSWYDASEYCKWVGGRLPTEAEWEKAARGTTENRYPWGNEWNRDNANTFETFRRETAPVGMFVQSKSPYGVRDMAGNVSEWVQDDYSPYPDAEFISPYYSRGFKVARGGSFNESGQVTRRIGPSGAEDISYGSVTTTFRFQYQPTDRLIEVGFRCVWEKGPMTVESSAAVLPSSVCGN